MIQCPQPVSCGTERCNRSRFAGLGSTAGVVDGSGNPTDAYTYDALGATRSHTGSSAQALKFTEELEDGDVTQDLYYLRARYYDPGLGRFWMRDP